MCLAFAVSACATTAPEPIVMPTKVNFDSERRCAASKQYQQDWQNFILPLRDLRENPAGKLDYIESRLDETLDKPLIRRSYLVERAYLCLYFGKVTEAIRDFEMLRDNELAFPRERVWISAELENWRNGVFPNKYNSPSPLIRIPAFMPPTAEASGHCHLKFDVVSNGQTTRIKALYCTAAALREPSLRSVEKWRYMLHI